MFPAFSVALSALKADSTAIDVVGNDLANLDTTGYKSTDLDFEDLMAQNVNSAEVGMGVGPVGTFTNYSPGDADRHRRSHRLGHSRQRILHCARRRRPDPLHPRR